MFAGSNGLEANKGDLHAGKCTNSVPGRVSHIKLAGELTHEEQNQSMKRDHVCDERVVGFVGPSWEIRVGPVVRL